VGECYSGAEIASFFEPDDRLVGARLQEMCASNREIPVAVEGIARTKADDLLLECDRFVD
jgi:hypothetical protein